MSSKIIFLDVDGPLIPGRAMFLPNQTQIMEVFDPCAVSLINKLCEINGYKLVIHSSWLRIMGEKETYDHCISQGLKAEYFDDDAWCEGQINWRYTRVAEWLKRHPDVTEYVILDDEPYSADLNHEIQHPVDLEGHLILVDYWEGFSYKQFQQVRDYDLNLKDYVI